MADRTKRPRSPGDTEPEAGTSPRPATRRKLTSRGNPVRRRDRHNASTRRDTQGRFDPPPHRPAGGAALPVPKAPLAPAVGQFHELRFPRRVGAIDDAFLSVGLPRLNAAAERGEIGLAAFAEAICSRLSSRDLDAAARIAPWMEPGRALYVLGALGAIASSLVRHERRASGNKQSSVGIALVPGLEPALLAFGKALGRAPLDNHDTAWAAGFPISFMGTDGEARFGRAVRDANRLLGESSALLMPLRKGEISLADTVDQLVQAQAHVKSYLLVQADLAANAFGDDFLAMRNFLAAYVVGGQEWQPPNATYTVGWTGFELSLGLLEGFRDVAQQRSSHMSREDRAAIDLSAQLPTLWELVARELGIGDDLWSVEPDALAERFEAAPLAIRDGVLAARALARETARMAGTHLGAIRKNLVEPVETMSQAERDRLGVAPTGGVSGTTLGHTFDLGKKRWAHPLVRMPVASRGEGK